MVRSGAGKGGRARAFYAQQLQAPDIPDSFGYLRDWLYELVGESGIGPSGDLLPLTHGAIVAWKANTGNLPTPDDVEALRHLDRVYRSAIAEHRAKAKPIEARADVPKVQQLPPSGNRKRRR